MKRLLLIALPALATPAPVQERSRRPRFAYLRTQSASFAAYVHVRDNRHDAFCKVLVIGVGGRDLSAPVGPAT